MKSIHLTILIFVQILLASSILYSNIVSASPLGLQNEQIASNVKPQDPLKTNELKPAAESGDTKLDFKMASILTSEKSSVPNASPELVVPKKDASIETPVLPKSGTYETEAKSLVQTKMMPEIERLAPEVASKTLTVDNKHKVELQQGVLKADPKPTPIVQEAPPARSVPLPVEPIKESVIEKPVQQAPVSMPDQIDQKPMPVPVAKLPVAIALVAESPVKLEDKKPLVENFNQVSEVPIHKTSEAVPVAQEVRQAAVINVQPAVVVQSPPVVKGGLGPLHMLATTLCKYQPEKPVADETLNALYAQRAALRKSLFEFMSLKFTNLEKFSTHLNAGLEVVPPKSSTITSKSSFVPTHGWPVVGKCTAHDLKLMAEAAWCECEDSNCNQPKNQVAPAAASTTSVVGSTSELQSPVVVLTNGNQRASGARFLDAPDQSTVISKILHVAQLKEASVVESSIENLNLTQQQLATIQAQAMVDLNRECRRNALKLTKGLFNHLAEDQSKESDSWPKLYSQLYEDDCARKRMIDIISALSSYRSESSSIRRDNVEFAFAMDDLRAKVLESEINTPLTFDKQFIEVEQFLQQSVKLMLANIDPDRAKLTSMRYRSLMSRPLAADDQCIELHQRLMAKNYPTDCNPNQFGQLPDVLRMTANSLELWSIEKELSKHSHKIPQEYPLVSSSIVHQKQDVNECIANLVAS